MNKKVKCVDRGINAHITVGKVYEVFMENSSEYQITCDAKSKLWYDKHHFVEVLQYDLNTSMNDLRGSMDKLDAKGIIDNASKVAKLIKQSRSKFDNLKVGQVWKRTNSNLYYILSQVGVSDYCLVGFDGFRWSDSIANYKSDLFASENPDKWELVNGKVAVVTN